MKKIKILFHIGFGKTATTWMQRQIFPKIKNSVYFGKYGKDDLMLNETFHKLYYELFHPLYDLQRYRSRNSAYLIRKCADAISSEIIDKHQKSGKKVDSAILSNETMLSYGTYNAELNVVQLKRVAERVKLNLLNLFSVEIQILVTFREQCSLLQSFYAYDYPHQVDKYPSFDDFIEDGVVNHHNEIFGSLWTDEIIYFVKSIFNNDTVLFVPYEILQQEGQSAFLENTVVKLGLMEKDDIEVFGRTPKENINKSQGGGNRLRDVSWLSKILDSASRHYKFLVPKPMYETLKRVVITIQNKQKVIVKQEIKITQKQCQQIRDLYRGSNTRTAELVSFDLEKLGYSVKK
jgi:hypothetical protein